MTPDPHARQDAPPEPQLGLCRGCDYPLRGLTEHRCPECGRPFDPSDPTTMNLGRPIGRLGRLFLRPIGWPTVALAVLAMLGVLWMSRWPAGGPVFGLVDVHYVRWVLTWQREQGRWPSLDLLFVVSTAIAIVVAATWLSRSALRHATIYLYKVPQHDRPRDRRRQLLLGVSLLCVVLAILYGWPVRAGRAWIETAANSSRPVRSARAARPSPIPLHPQQSLAALGAATVHLRTAAERQLALHILIERRTLHAPRLVAQAARGERDEALLATELRLLALFRDRETAELFTGHLRHRSPAVRAAAADALGILHRPAYPIPFTSAGFWPSAKLGQIELADVISVARQVSTASNATTAGRSDQVIPDHEIHLPDSVRASLVDVMTEGASLEEREAAARALVAWPPAKYRLRIAEWGVWLADGGDEGTLRLVRAFQDEIPPFVHRTGNPLAELERRVIPITVIFKPVVHVTASETMAVDVQVQIRKGRPWYAYPKPDDFNLTVGTGRAYRAGDAGGAFGSDGPQGGLFAKRNDATLLPPDPPDRRRIEDLREGYPWLTPAHRSYGPGAGGSVEESNEITAVGLRWQSLVVSPKRLDWMTPPVVPDDAAFRWWSALRDVPCGWVSSRGETERFLYYDGPTRALTPVRVVLARDGLRVDVRGFPDHWPPRGIATGPFRDVSEADTWYDYRETDWFDGTSQSVPVRDYLLRHGMLVTVDGGEVTARAFSVPDRDATLPLGKGDLLLGRDAVERKFGELLLARGLNGPEADGMIASWRAQFFQTQGTRFLLLMSPADYDALCPIQASPPPTELFRVGIVLTEFGLNSPTK